MGSVSNSCKAIRSVGTFTRRIGRSSSHGSSLQTRVTLVDRLPCSHGRRGIVRVSSGRVHAKKCQSFRFQIRSALGEEVSVKQNDLVQKSDQEVESSSALHLEESTLEQSKVGLSNENVWSRTLDISLRSYFREIQTGWEQILDHPNPVEALGDVVGKEWRIIYLVTCTDITAAMMPYWLIGINLLAGSPFLQSGDFYHFFLQAATTMSKEVCYSFLYLYSFNLANQYKGADGDAIDKPWRPIPSGLLTRQGALARCFLVNALYTFVSWQLGVLPWTLLWQSVNAAQFLGLEKDKSFGGLGRSLSMFNAVVVQSSVGVSLATTMTPTLQWWAVARGAVFGNHHWMADFRDIDGDRQVGRTTFPLMFGVDNARKVMAFIFFMEPLFYHFVVMKDSYYSTPQLFVEGFGVILCLALAYRVLNLKTPAEDHETYTIWLGTYWHNYTFLLLGPAFLKGLDSHL